MRSLHVGDHKALAVYPVAAPLGYHRAFGVRSEPANGFYEGTYNEVRVRYVVLKLGSKSVRVSKFECSCKSSKKNELCYHIRLVIRRAVPSASFWRTKQDAQRQRRKKYPVLVQDRVYWLTDRTRRRNFSWMRL